MAETSSPDEPNLAATSWTILGMLSYKEEVSGYDIKKWADWSIRYFYWSPSFSQIYSELRKLEKLGLATSRLDLNNGARSRRLYQVTQKGLDALTEWVNETPADPPVLKHSVVLRVMNGHMADPTRLKDMLNEHVAYAEDMHRQASFDAEGSLAQPGWAYSHLALKWAERYYESERNLALEMLNDLDEATAAFENAESGTPNLIPGFWRKVQQDVDAAKASTPPDPDR
ncbi:PadR family transcriptional regulator [Mycobacterium sp. CBMA271]|uniref:PadR family transcriptional regulator n=1 Tax=unclassified Mycobacteroides TaxID=2618759 RepID=UPI0012DC33F9|nr:MULTISPECIES: PadR family transcriptional regulator [unclassified Mycobacteroides]MUM18103.1 PadR family transcriptional regulator [Mycobacteroides sp. CBMA 326]MUM23412.1 PadR family transcriptional regulator [Mycobacteroides sp. CBMA 271]